MNLDKSIRKYLPDYVYKRLFGDRDKYGKIPNELDADWIKFNNNIDVIFINTQKKGILNIINNIGYSEIKKIDLNKKSILEIGPGELTHIKFWKEIPENYTLYDVEDKFINLSKQKLKLYKIKEINTVSNLQDLKKIDSNKFDYIFAFYCFEHILNLDNIVKEVNRVLKDDGQLIGAIPSEGSFLWGLGRLLSTRIYFYELGSTINER